MYGSFDHGVVTMLHPNLHKRATELKQSCSDGCHSVKEGAQYFKPKDHTINAWSHEMFCLNGTPNAYARPASNTPGNFAPISETSRKGGP